MENRHQPSVSHSLKDRQVFPGIVRKVLFVPVLAYSESEKIVFSYLY